MSVYTGVLCCVYFSNNKQNLQILVALHMRNIQPKLNRINFETKANVLKCLLLLTLFIETTLKNKRYTIRQYKRSFLQCMQKLYHFCNAPSIDDGPREKTTKIWRQKNVYDIQLHIYIYIYIRMCVYICIFIYVYV